jgi:hypothetical protein
MEPVIVSLGFRHVLVLTLPRISLLSGLKWAEISERPTIPHSILADWGLFSGEKSGRN